MKTSKSLPWSELKVGIIIIVAFALLGFGILQLGAGEGWFSPSYRLYVRMENTLGLKAGSIVRLAGVEVGNVEDIAFSSDTSDRRLVIALKVQDRYRAKIRQDSMVTIRSMGLLGDKYADITVGSPQSAALAPGSVLRETRDTQLSGVISGATTGLEGLNVILAQVRKLLGNVASGEGTAGALLKDRRLYDQLSGSAASLEQVAADLKSGKGSLGKFIEDPVLYNNLVEVSAKAKDVADKINRGSIARLSEDESFYKNLVEVSQNLNEVSRSAKALVQNLEGGSIAKISGDNELYEKVGRISTRLDGVIAKLEDGQGSMGKLLSDEKLYNNMNKFFEDADALVLDIKQNPKRYIKLSVF